MKPPPPARTRKVGQREKKRKKKAVKGFDTARADRQSLDKKTPIICWRIRYRWAPLGFCGREIGRPTFSALLDGYLWLEMILFGCHDLLTHLQGFSHQQDPEIFRRKLKLNRF